MERQDFVDKLITSKTSANEKSWAFAPSNIALCKYWGKRDSDLNLPTTPSLSISLGSRGSYVTLKRDKHDALLINGEEINLDHPEAIRTFNFLDLFREKNVFLRVESWSNIPIAAGLASSASYFAALVKAADKLFLWNASLQTLSCLARLGSGSASRSLNHGFVEWQDYSDPFLSYGIPLDVQWSEFCVGLIFLDASKKSISSRNAMLHTRSTSSLYQAWCDQSRNDFKSIKEAVLEKDFDKLGEVAECNALSMHATMMAARPPIIYAQSSTLQIIHQIHSLRKQGLSVYFTQDAGPNIKILFQEKDIHSLKEAFPSLEVIRPFKEIPEDISSPFVICVNEQDEILSFEEKQKAHREKIFHRAISVMLHRTHNGKNEVLIQKRHPEKYHSGGLWSNTCCSHPQLSETLLEAAERCLKEETGICTPLKEIGHFSYSADFKNGTSEAEYDHVFTGTWHQDLPIFDPKEMTDLEWKDLNDVCKDAEENSHKYTAWFPDVLKIIKNHVLAMNVSKA